MADKLEKIQRNFLWMGMEEKKRLALVSWDKVYYPKINGGLVIRKISHFNKALMAKTAWKLTCQDSDWGRIMRAKYLGQGSFHKILREEEIPDGSKI